MAEVISGDKLKKHNIDKYSFKILALGGKKQLHQKQEQPSPPLQTQPSVQQEEKKASSSKDTLIESLLKKTDEMSSNFIKLQMKLEAMQEEHKQELEQIKEASFAEGFTKGKEEAQKECETKYQESLNLFATSISKLESNAKEYNNALETLKNELASAAIEIAQEVVMIELQKNSIEVAKKLADSLIEELKDASSITLKVNPKDYTALSQEFEHYKHIKVIADHAVSEGGVIAISDLENIDAQIPKRFERVKRVILSE